MDKQQAQFILHSFRPDGADASDLDFAEALQLAAEDRELGEWLADERAADAEFAAALSDVCIPEELRLHILAVMRGEKPFDPSQDLKMDELLSDAFSSVEAPEGLREQILSAMQMEKADQSELSKELEKVVGISSLGAKKSTRRPSWLPYASVAAAVTLGVFLASQIDLGVSGAGETVANVGQESRNISSHDVQQVAGHLLNNKLVLDVKNSQETQVNSWLVNHELPAPSVLPDGLRGMKIMGCKRLQLPSGVPASLLCFVKKSGSMVHLVVINNDFIKDTRLPSMNEIKKADCYSCPKTGWNVARWRDRDNTFVLLEKSELVSQGGVIQYF